MKVVSRNPASAGVHFVYITRPAQPATNAACVTNSNYHGDESWSFSLPSVLVPNTSYLTTLYMLCKKVLFAGYLKTFIFFYLVFETIGTAATPGLLCQPRVIVKMIVESR
jgi:hypothetical protein